jgi:hypothetical protein
MRAMIHHLARAGCRPSGVPDNQSGQRIAERMRVIVSIVVTAS